jgi:hypothetical protein
LVQEGDKSTLDLSLSTAAFEVVYVLKNLFLELVLMIGMRFCLIISNFTFLYLSLFLLLACVQRIVSEDMHPKHLSPVISVQDLSVPPLTGEHADLSSSQLASPLPTDPQHCESIESPSPALSDPHDHGEEAAGSSHNSDEIETVDKDDREFQIGLIPDDLNFIAFYLALSKVAWHIL